MIRSLVAVAVAALFSAPAFATNNNVQSPSANAAAGAAAGAVAVNAPYTYNSLDNRPEVNTDVRSQSSQVTQNNLSPHNTATSAGGQGGIGVGGQGTASASANGAQGNTTVVTQQSNYKRGAASPADVNIAIPNGVCRYGAGASVTTGTFGVSIGGTAQDEECNARYDAATLMALGLPEAAVARMAQNPAVARALDDAYGTSFSAKPEAPAVNANNWQGVQ
jgi:hypothetical protein